MIAEALLQGEAEAMMRVAIERAKSGDAAALRMCLDRLAPPSRHRTVQFELPPLANAQDAVSALAAITTAVAAGELTPAEAGELSKLLDGFVRLREGSIMERQLAMLERAAGKPALENHQLNQFYRLRETDQINHVSQNDHGGES